MKPLNTTPREVMLDAIQGEVETRMFYLRLADRSPDEEVARRLRNLADRELVHRAKLERRFREMFGEDPPRPRPASEPSLPSSPISLRSALKLALDHERNQESEYRHLAERAPSPDLVRLFVELAELEWGHKTELESEYNSLAEPDDFLSDL